jgi:N-acetylneuraminate lyase
MMKEIAGILPATFTPLDERGNVDRLAIERMIRQLFDRGVHGVYVCGSTGEGILLSFEERQAVVAASVDAAAGRGAVMVHIGALATADAVRLADQAERAGADAISALPPFPFGRTSPAIVAHYRAIAEACSLPLYLYNFPSLVGVTLTADDLGPLLELPSVRGMKFSDYNLFEEFRAIRLRRDFEILHGSDETLLYGLLMGAVGGIGGTYSFAPDVFAAIYNAFRAGEWERANRLQLQISDFISRFLRLAAGNFIGLGKAAMQLLGSDCGPPRSPNLPVELQTRRQLEELLAQFRRQREADTAPPRHGVGASPQAHAAKQV